MVVLVRSMVCWIDGIGFGNDGGGCGLRAWVRMYCQGLELRVLSLASRLLEVLRKLLEALWKSCWCICSRDRRCIIRRGLASEVVELCYASKDWGPDFWFALTTGFSGSSQLKIGVIGFCSSGQVGEGLCTGDDRGTIY